MTINNQPVRLTVRHDTTENWASVADSEVLLRGEIGIEFASGTAKMKVGDGVTPWGNLPYTTANASVKTWGDLVEIAGNNYNGETACLGLTKPSYLDPVDVAILNANSDLIDSKIMQYGESIDFLGVQLENLINSTTPEDNLELIDIRTANDGTVHTTAGDAVRSLGKEITDMKENLGEFLGGELVDGLKYEGSQLWLTSGGVAIGEPVTIKGGSGSGSDGMYVMSLENLMDGRILSVTQEEPVVLEVKYSSADDEGIDDGAGIGTILVNQVKKATQPIAQGENKIDITKYLSIGTNKVHVQVENSEGTSKTLIYEVTVISLAITTTQNSMGTYSGEVELPYVLTGQGLKTIHFIMDGYELGTESISAISSSQTYKLPPQYDGGHIFEMYAETISEGLTIRSNRLRIGMMYTSSTMTDQAVLINYNVQNSQQGELLSIPYMCYNPFAESAEVTLKVIREGGIVYSSKTITVDQSPKTWVTQDYPVGLTTFQISCGNAVESVQVQVAESSFDRAILTDGMVMQFSAAGRSNSESNPATWIHGAISAEFSGFGWAGADGWVEDSNGQTVQRFLPDDFMTIPLEPFASDFRNSGYTIEAEFATHNVRDYDSIVAQCYSGGRGFLIKSQQASLSSEQSSVSVQFKEDTKVRITFVVEQKNLSRFVYVYINGVMCGVSQYPADDNFAQSDPVGIVIGAESCGLDLHVLRIYKKGQTRHEQLNNYICDRPTMAERKTLDELNDVLDDSGNVTIGNQPMNVPYLIMECEETPAYKGDKKKNKSVTFVDQINPERSYTAAGVQLDVQGTSSAGYPIKNYKIAQKNGITYTNSGETASGFPVFEEGLLGETICFKADFASSENANNAMLVDYYEENCPYKTPPQEEDDRVRQGVRGFPICLFWQNTKTGEVKFLSKGEYMDDKSCENVFGFDRVKYPNCECWEIKNNTSDRVVFKSSDYDSTALDKDGNEYPAWTDDFEARFPDLDTPYQDVTQLKRLTDWLVSTNRDLVDTEEEKAARLQKFIDECDQYLVKEACIFFYQFTEIFLMVDNRAKNVFLTTFDGQHWFSVPYDFDTAIGINNEGGLTFEYNLEDIDQVNGEDVFNGQSSALWRNVRDAFKSEIMAMYQTLRSSGTLSYESIRDKMTKHQRTWPEAIWNEDSYNKYLLPYLVDGKNYLDMLQGDKAAQRDFWLYNGFRYRDSKYQAGDADKKFITLRCYDTGDIDVTPYSHIWPRIKFGSSTVTNRGFRNETYTMKCPLDNMNDTEVYIYSADCIASVGDLSHLKVGLAIFSDATKLQEIILGSTAEGYENPNLYSLDVGNNELLTLVNIANCTSPDLKTVDMSGCHGLETVIATGTKLTGITLPNGGHLKHLELPPTLANLTVQNQKNLETVIVEGLDNLTTLRIENSPGLDIEDYILNSPNLDRVRITGVEWTATNEVALKQTIDKLKDCIGMDANGDNTDLAAVSGRVYVDSISDTLLEDINDTFPELVVVAGGAAKFFVRYVNYDNTLLYRYIVSEGEAAINPITAGYISQPVRPDTETATYRYVGWSEIPSSVNKPYHIVAKYVGTYRVDFCGEDEAILESQWVPEGDGAKDPVTAGTVLKPTKRSTAQFNYEYSGWDRDFSVITKPLVLKPSFEEILRSYKCFFYNDNELVQESIVFYGEHPTFVGDTESIKKMIGDEPSDYYEFTGWSPSPDAPITGVSYYYAQFAFNGYIDDDWSVIIDACRNGDIGKYGLGGRKIMTYSIGKTENTVELEIVGHNHDELETADENYNGGKETAAQSFIVKVMGNTARIMNQTQHASNSGSSTLNVGGWELSDLREWMRTTLMAAMPPELQANIKPVIKVSDLGFYDRELNETVDTLWIPSERELNAESSGVLRGQGEPYPVYTTADSRMKQNLGGGLKAYWTRSTGQDGQQYYRYIGSTGYPGNVGASAQNLGIAFGFCL